MEFVLFLSKGFKKPCKVNKNYQINKTETGG
jgi:hypothetical protein